MQGLQDRTRLHTRRARNLHARTLAPREGEGVAHQTTLGHSSRPCAGGGSTAFSGDRAQARRKAVDAPEARDRRGGGASAPLPKHRPCLAPWQSLAVVCARVTTRPEHGLDPRELLRCPLEQHCAHLWSPLLPQGSACAGRRVTTEHHGGYRRVNPHPAARPRPGSL
jgi:hypothetical protein